MPPRWQKPHVAAVTQGAPRPAMASARGPLLRRCALPLNRAPATPAPSDGLRQRGEVLDDTLAQQEVLLPTTRQRTRWTLDDPNSRDGLPAPELLPGQVEFNTARQPVPPVEAVLGAVEVHLADH